VRLDRPEHGPHKLGVARSCHAHPCAWGEVTNNAAPLRANCWKMMERTGIVDEIRMANFKRDVAALRGHIQCGLKRDSSGMAARECLDKLWSITMAELDAVSQACEHSFGTSSTRSEPHCVKCGRSYSGQSAETAVKPTDADYMRGYADGVIVVERELRSLSARTKPEAVARAVTAAIDAIMVRVRR